MHTRDLRRRLITVLIQAQIKKRKNGKKITAGASSPSGAAGRSTDRCPITMLMITEPWTNNYIQSFFM